MPTKVFTRTLHRDRALTVYWQGQKITGLLRYGLRRPHERVQIELNDFWPQGTECSAPWLLHGEGWAVDLWTVRLEQMPCGSEWRMMLQIALDRRLQAGYTVAWFATEGDFADPPALFDPAVTGEGVYAAASRDAGFICRDEGAGDLRVLTDADLAEVRNAAVAVWSAREPGPSAET